MQEQAMEQVRALIEFLENQKDHLVIDADVHATDTARLEGEIRERYESTPDYYQGRPISAEDILREMAMADVDMAMIWQNPAATRYVGDQEQDSEALLAANRYIFETACKWPERFIPAGWTDPKACGMKRALKLVETFVEEFGFIIIKLNPAQNRFAIDSDQALKVVDKIVELGAIPAFHFGADTPYTPAEGLAKVAARHPKHPMIAVHMGGGGAGYIEADEMYAQSRALGLQHPNLKFVMSAKRDTHIESDLITYQLAGEPYSRNLFCGSDAPYGRMTWNFGGYRQMFESLIAGAQHTDARVRAKRGLFTQDDATNYLGRNFAELVIEGGERLLAAQGD